MEEFFVLFAYLVEGGSRLRHKTLAFVLSVDVQMEVMRSE